MIKGETYYLMQKDHDVFALMEKVVATNILTDDVVEVAVVDSDGYYGFSGLVNAWRLLTAEQIVKLYEEHLMLDDAFERHG